MILPKQTQLEQNMSTPEIKLYGYSTSPFVRKVGCCLYYKNLPFEFVPVNPTDPQSIAFTEQTQVPVLKIGDTWKKDSAELALWLDELSPEKPLFGQNTEQRKSILELDEWVTDSFIHGMFRNAYQGEVTTSFRHMAWRLAAIVSSQTPMPEEFRNAWPDLLKQAPFIKTMMESVDLSETIADMQARIVSELVDKLKDGPFLGGFDQPSLADFALFPQLVFSYMVGMEQNLDIAQHHGIADWINRVKQFMPKNPLLVPDFIITNEL